MPTPESDDCAEAAAGIPSSEAASTSLRECPTMIRAIQIVLAALVLSVASAVASGSVPVPQQTRAFPDQAACREALRQMLHQDRAQVTNGRAINTDRTTREVQLETQGLVSAENGRAGYEFEFSRRLIEPRQHAEAIGAYGQPDCSNGQTSTTPCATAHGALETIPIASARLAASNMANPATGSRADIKAPCIVSTFAPSGLRICTGVSAMPIIVPPR
jgi:hypothetical protein